MDIPLQEADIDIENLNLAFSWLFNFSAADIPSPSSIAYYFWAMQDQMSDEALSIEPYQVFKSILAFPFWHFQENNYGNIRLQETVETQGLAKDFYTTAAIGSPYTQIAVDR